MSIVINGVTCEVISTGYSEKADQSGPSATRGYLCDWDQRFLVANSLLGIVKYTGSGATGQVTFANPGRLDELPGLLTMGVRIEGKGQPFQNAAGLGYPYAIVWTDYGILPYVAGGGSDGAQIDPNTSFTYATQELDSSNQYVEIPKNTLYYADSNTPSTLNRSVIVTVIEMKITFHRLPYIPMPALVHADKINDATFLGIETGKVKFDGITVSRDFSGPDGSQIEQKASFHFSYRPVADWNMVPSASNPGNWTLLKFRTRTISPYVYYDLRNVWPGSYVNSV
jgi:hypothetical protein